MRDGNSPVEALFAKVMIKDKLLMALIDSGSCVNFLGVTLYQQLGESKEESQNLTAFITPLGLNNWKRLPMGLASAPGAFQNLMD